MAKYKLNNGLLIAGGITTVLLVHATYKHFRHTKHNNLTSELLKELNKNLHPESKGILGEKAFDPKFHEETRKKVNGRVITLSKSKATELANSIKKAWGTFNDNESMVYSTFRKMKDKLQVSQVAKAYEDNGHGNLINTLMERLENHEIKKVLNIVNPLPTFRTL